MTRVLIVDDEPQLLQALASTCAPASYDVETAPRRRHRARAGGGARRPTWSSSTSACRTWTASRSIARPARLVARRRSSCCPPATVRPTRSTPSTPAPTTTSPSRSAWTSCWPGSAPPCAAPARPTDAPAVVTAELHGRPRRQAGHAADGATSGSRRPNGTCWRSWSATRAARQPAAAPAGGLGPGYETETNYLRVYMAHLRRKLEPDPSQPRHLITEPGMGYRFEP